MPASRPLYLFKGFHTPTCQVHAVRDRSGKPLTPGQKKLFKACDCMIYITGMTAKGEFVPRQSTGLRDWAAAEAYLADLNKQVVTEIVQGDKGITLESATKKFTDAHERNVSKKLLDAYKLVLGRLTTYAAGNGVTYCQNLTYDLCSDFITYGLKTGENTKSTYQAKLKKFLDEAYKREWIKKDIGDQLQTIIAEYEAGEPYTDEELTSIFDAAEALNGGINGYASNGKTFRLLLEFMNETGLRVSNGIRYDPAQCVKSKTGLWKYTYAVKKKRKTKKPKIAVGFVSDRLKQDIDNAKWFSERFPFAYRSFADDKNERAVFEGRVKSRV